ncbi:MAG: RidA family protein [Mycobacteriales bacterium]
MSSPIYAPFRQLGAEVVVFSGLVGRQDGVAAESLTAQLDLIFEQLDVRLAAADLTRGDVCKTTVWLADMADWSAMNVPYEAYFAGAEPPARSAVGAQLIPGCLVELEAWATRTHVCGSSR